jgi:hypothetical protein
MRRLLALSFALALAGCGADNRQAGGVTKGEADALDDAAEMVEQSRPPVDAPQPAQSGQPSN